MALAAANAGLGPAQQAQEEARSARLRHALVDNMSGALGDGRGSGSFLPDAASSAGPEPSENSFSRWARWPPVCCPGSITTQAASRLSI